MWLLLCLMPSNLAINNDNSNELTSHEFLRFRRLQTLEDAYKDLRKEGLQMGAGDGQ